MKVKTNMAKEKKAVSLEDVLAKLNEVDEKIDTLLEGASTESGEEEAEEAESEEEAEEEEAEETEAEESEEEGEEGEEEAEEEVTEAELPDKKTIKKLKGKELAAVAKQIGLDTEELEEDDVRSLLLTVHDIGSDEIDAKADKSRINALAKALEVDVEAKAADTLKSLQEFLGVGEEAESEESADEEAEEGADEEAEETEEEGEEDAEESGEEEAEEAESEEEAEEEEAPEVSEKDKKARLAAYNKVAKKKLTKYSSLEALLTDDEGEVAEWGKPYVKDEEGYCCGLPLKELKGNVGQCLVTNKKFKYDGDTFKAVK